MHLPLYIDVEGRRITIFGGGMVGERRARLFASHGARVTVAASSFTQGLLEMGSQGLVELVQIELPRDLEEARRLITGSWMVVIATSSPGVNSMLAREARMAGVLVNNATSAMDGDVIVPFSTVVWGGVHLASTSLGEAGIAARRALEEASRHLASRRDLEALYRAMRIIKRTMKRLIPDPRERFRLYFRIEEDPAFREAVSRGDVDAAVRRALEILASEDTAA